MLVLLSVITYLDRVCISLAGPRMQRDLGITPSGWGWVLGAFVAAYALFEIPTGSMGDRIGARSVLTRVVGFLFGAGEAGAYPNSSCAISRWFPMAERARAHGFVWMASRVGGAVAPLLVVPIQMRFGWRASFWLFGVFGLVWAVVWYRWFRDDPREKPQVTTEELAEIGPPRAGGHTGMPWRRALASGNLWKIMVMYHLYCWGSCFYLTWLPSYLQLGRGFSEATMKYMATLPFILGAMANLGGGFLSDWLSRRYGLKIGRRSVGATGLFLAGCGLLGAALIESKLAAVLFLAVGYGCQDAFLPTSWALCLDVGKRYAGAITGSMNMAGQVGAFACTVAFGHIVEHFHSYNAPLFPMAVAMAISAAMFLWIDPTEPIVAEEPE
jgi:MFS family permease